ncbi:MAG: hypothetical protein IJ306_01005 [Oscillospiraceae bacterium]|nr:hypothetical protein [Oscillospiraceae bacterium]
MKATTSDRLKDIMNLKNMKQVDILEAAKPFCEKYNIKLGRNDLSQYVSGKVIPSQKKLTVLSSALNVNELWLMGYDVPMNADYGMDENDSSLLRNFPKLKPLEVLPKEIEAINVFMSLYGKQIVKLDGIYYIDANPLNDDDVNLLLNTVAISIKNVTDTIEVKKNKEFRNFLTK